MCRQASGRIALATGSLARAHAKPRAFTHTPFIALALLYHLLALLDPLSIMRDRSLLEQAADLAIALAHPEKAFDDLERAEFSADKLDFRNITGHSALGEGFQKPLLLLIGHIRTVVAFDDLASQEELGTHGISGELGLDPGDFCQRDIRVDLQVRDD